MRLPGTFNLNGKNDLPTAELLLQYAELKQRRREAKLNRHTDNTKLQAQGTDAKASQPKEKASDKKKPDTKAEEENADDSPAAADFTEAQDKALIELKLKSKSWKEIANEIGKDVGKIKQRFNQIKPNDFDAQITEFKKKAAEERKGGNKGDAHGGETQGKQKGGNRNQAKRDDEPQDEVSDAGTWATPDENWSPTDVGVLETIVDEELRAAFGRISRRLAMQTQNKKKVHPASIAEKVFGEKPSWADDDNL